MASFLCTTNINTFQDLLARVSRLERDPPVVANLQPNKFKKDGGKRYERVIASTSSLEQQQSNHVLGGGEDQKGMSLLVRRINNIHSEETK